jgi:hypothetical protein
MDIEFKVSFFILYVIYLFSVYDWNGMEYKLDFS